jgi:hypothetical protein
VKSQTLNKTTKNTNKMLLALNPYGFANFPGESGTKYSIRLERSVKKFTATTINVIAAATTNGVFILGSFMSVPLFIGLNSLARGYKKSFRNKKL